MRKLGKYRLLHEDEYHLYLKVIEDLQKLTDLLELDAMSCYERDRDLLKFRIREEALAEKLSKAPSLHPRNWDQVYKPWLENFRQYFYTDTIIT